MKFTIDTTKYDTDKMNRFEVRALVSKLTCRLGKADEAETEAIKQCDKIKLENINQAKEGLTKIIEALKKYAN